MDYFYYRLTLLVFHWILIMSQLVSCQTPVHNNQLNLHQHHLHPHHHTGGIAHRNPLPSEFPIIRTSRDTKQDESSSMSMLQWMRQMIFKTKSMYMKHRLEFELSGCMMGFVRKIISLVYNSLYSFNKKLMFAKNIKMEDIRGVGKASNSLPMTQNENSSTTQHENSTSEKINEIIANKTPTLLVKENSTNVNNNETIPDKMRNNTEKVLKPNNNVDKRHVIKEKQSNTRKKETRKVVKKPAREKQTINKKGAGNKGGVTIITSKLIQNNTNISKKSKETSVGVNNTTELQKMYSKLYDINGELKGNINTMNELYRNISLNIDSLKDVMKNISNEKMDLRLKPLNISESLNNTIELQKMYSKLYDINGELKRNINTMNELYRNISLNIDSLKDVMKNISNEKMDLRLKPLNISESLNTNVFNTNDKLSNNMNNRRSTLHTLDLEETQTDKTNIWRNDKGEFNANKTKNAGIEVSIEKSLEEDKVHNHLISSNEIPDTIVGDVGRPNYKDMKIFPSNRYNRRSTLDTLEETQTDKTNIWGNDKGEFNANKTKNAGIEVSIEKSLEEDKVHNHLISSNEIPDTIVSDVGRPNYKDMKIFPSNRYNFTQNQVKVIS
ncbi:putative uncharacterized protein DDB_G0282133 [Diaphorina citri]|uniref:Uncharacterized protein n=1 Tax=Diaphorina citri TaxID=121845 RepID=A0A1S3DA82_DIACI|nr:putative uncharacterized protein DDB_G0282133 [Diaphorina citri]